MFADVATARQALDEYFNEAGVELMLRLMQPVVLFEPVEGRAPAPLGATRIGGTPDLPLAEPWPVRPVLANAEAIIAGGGSRHGPHLRRHLAQPLPFGFLAQVDLAEAAALGEVARELPHEGRLLFFYDGGLGPWHDGTESCRVIWDRTPASQLERKPIPHALVDLHRDFCAALSPDAPPPDPSTIDASTPSHHWGPERAMRLRSQLRPPARLTFETDPASGDADAELIEALEDEDFEASFDALFEDRVTNRQQLLGMPLPEQDDPRYSAAILGGFDVLLLLQIDLHDYLQQRNVEGTVYFLIDRNDLAARAFDRVITVYQQT